MSAIDRDVFGVESFRKDGAPNYRCPQCGSHLSWENELIVESASSRFSEIYEDETYSGRFRADLVCPSKRCGDTVFAIGEVAQWTDHDHGFGDYDPKTYFFLRPLAFHPPLRLFEIPSSVAYPVVERIESSFRLLHSSNSAALNEIRSALECLMTELGVATIRPDGRFLTLDTRVALLESKYDYLKNRLKAAKWLGNAGAHATNVVRKDVLDAYELLYDVLHEIYSGRKAIVEEITQRVNLNRGPGPTPFD